MKCVSDEVEFRGFESKSFKGDNNETVNMTVLRFDDVNGLQNEFYVMDTSKIAGFDSLIRGSNYNLDLEVGKGNKVKLLAVYEK